MKYVCRCLFLIALAGIAIGSLLPSEHVRLVFTFGDLVVHFGAYLVCGVLAILSFHGWQPRMGAVLVTAIVGLMIELVQPAVGREFAYHDLAANSFGLMSAVGIVIPISRIQNLAAVDATKLSPGLSGQTPVDGG